VVIELKYAEGDKLDEACAEALNQISDKKYDAHLKLDGMKNMVKFGIACFRKHCRVVKGEEKR
jgi:dTDP-glucose pyrophosphorylase